MTDLRFLQLQPVEPDEENSPLDAYPEDETINLDDDSESQPLDVRWSQLLDTAEESPEVLTSDMH